MRKQQMGALAGMTFNAFSGERALEVNGSMRSLPTIAVAEELDDVCQEALTTLWLLATENPLPNTK